MLLSHNKKFLFIAVHKTGSTSVRRYLVSIVKKKQLPIKNLHTFIMQKQVL